MIWTKNRITFIQDPLEVAMRKMMGYKVMPIKGTSFYNVSESYTDDQIRKFQTLWALVESILEKELGTWVNEEFQYNLNGEYPYEFEVDLTDKRIVFSFNSKMYAVFVYKPTDSPFYCGLCEGMIKNFRTSKRVIDLLKS
jgi:hypothetical protein